MSTSIVLVALSGLLASAASNEEPGWLREYGKARQRGQKEEKPLAVFIGSGKTGWNQLSKEGSLGKEVNKLLAEHYVCLYVNMDEPSGKRLASAFEVSGPGVVISTTSGQQQAFRYEGRLGNPDLARYLTRYADPELALQHTETVEVARVSYYQPATPVYTQPMQGSFSPSFGNVSRGSC